MVRGKMCLSVGKGQPNGLMHYDLEVSGFPSSHAGHLVLLGLTNQHYPHCVEVAQRYHLKVVLGRIPIPDLRIEYVNENDC